MPRVSAFKKFFLLKHFLGLIMIIDNYEYFAKGFTLG